MNRTDLITSPINALPPAFGGALPTDLVELRPMIEGAFEAWLNKTESTATRTAYRNDVVQFLKFCGIQPEQIEEMTQIVPDDVTKWRDHLLASGGRTVGNREPAPASNATVARKITSLRSFFSFLQVGGYRGGNPAHPNFVNAPSVPDEGVTPAIHPKSLGLLLNCPDEETPAGIRDRAILAVFAYMALRVDELHHINVGNIARDGEHTIIRIKGKGNEIRKGVLPPIAATPVNAWIELADIESDRRGPLFRPGNSARGAGRDGFARKRLSVRSIQELIKRYCREVGIDEAVSVHSLRVTAATEADKAGVPLIAIQKWLGHKDPRTTLRYIRGHEDLDRSPAYTIRYG
ncbi:tyrosine-type recombinase/integrase [Rhodopirellula bahusiensis]|uniref:Integrase n=1 Tax=Rhodopirellula bahusiensis TaxID=2014065 RepID=A0A2G1VXJ6_9BACT|nr:tyrosine-type recombinase/integrase [Rhodopirellula bahusiensis]PHQ31503.1 integrase [Rhodopirellula bahusiensis]